MLIFLEEALVMVTYGEPDEVSRNLLRRSANVFEQAYVRFLDLQKAEAQARESQIQLSLERVRAKSMAMQSSNELETIIQVVHDQFVELDIALDHAGFIIDYKTNDDMIIWLADEHKVTPQIRLPYFDSPHWNSFITAKEKGHKLFVNHLDFKTKNKFYKQIFKHIPELPEDARSFYLKIPSLTIATSLIDTIGLYIENFSGVQYGEEDQKILLRFGEEFQRAYTRFLDLEKAEAQAREANIQLALERVRARTMAMKTQHDLLDVIKVFGSQLISLGLQVDTVSVIHGVTKTDWDLWLHTPNTGAEPFRVFVPYRDMAYFKKTIKNIEAYERTGNPIQIKSFSKKEKDEFNTHYFKYAPPISEAVKAEAFAQEKCTIIDAFLENVTVSLVNYGIESFTEEDIKIFTRFSLEFKQTYTRFLDLKKAEAQTREAQIEAALEKVRSRSMGMQKSTELLEVITVVSQQLQTLGFRFSHVSFINNSLKEHNSFWVAATGLPNPMRFIIPYKPMPIIDNLRKAQKNKDAFYTDVSTIKEHQQWFEHLLKHSGENEFPKEIIDYQMSKGLARSVSIHTNIMLALANTQSIPYSDYENKIIARFGQVFEQSYTRFLDLQRAESQAREAQIEMSLEKVRSRTMAMQTSSELPEAANTLFLEVQALGIPAWSAGYCIWNEDKSLANCNMSSEGEIQKGFMLPSIGEGYDFLSPLEKDEQFHMSSLGGKDLVKHYDFMKTLPGVGEILSELVNAGLELPTFQIFHICYFKHGYVMFITYEPVPQAHDIFKRFTSVFEQTYTRFLDLKQAEAQMRKAQIETSLERVRAKAMSMQNSDELDEVLSVLCEQFDILGIVPMSTHMTVLDIENNTFTFRETGKYGNRSFGEQTVALNAMDNWKETVEKWKADEATAINKLHFPKEQLPEVWKVFHDSFASMPEESRIIPDDYPEGIYHTAGKHPFGYIGMNQIRPATKEEEDIVIKFANEFGRAYQRFLDLQKAEAQAREAQIEASLERVRSHSMGMQGTKDFAEVTTEMFNQLRSFGEDLFATGIVFCDKHDGHVEQWHSIPGGSMLSPMIVPIDLDYIHQYRYDQWKAGKRPLFHRNPK